MSHRRLAVAGGAAVGALLRAAAPALAVVQPPDVGMSWEGIMALCALGTALAGIVAISIKFGGLAKEVEAIKSLRDEVSALRSDIGDMSRMVYEMRGAMRTTSRPPLEDRND